MTAFIRICCLFLLGGFSARAQQPIEIMVLGTSHYNEAKDSLYHRKVIDKLKRFNPDMVLGEYVRPEDYLQLEEESYRRKVNDPLFAYINRLNPGRPASDKRIAKAKQALARHGNFHQRRMELAVQYLKKYDVANAQYQLYIMETYQQQHFGEGELRWYRQHLGPADSLRKYGLYNPNNEYTAIIFPLMYELGLPEIYSTDYQAYDVKWTNAWRLVAYIMHYINRIAKMDPQSEEAKIVRKTDQALQEIARQAEQENLGEYEYNNSPLNARQSDIRNFYGGEMMFGFSKNYPEKQVGEMIRYWRLRNEGMARLALEQIRKEGAKRAVIAAGSAHQQWIADILAKEKDVKLVPFPVK